MKRVYIHFLYYESLKKYHLLSFPGRLYANGRKKIHGLNERWNEFS